jgi:hypothetical protein
VGLCIALRTESGEQIKLIADEQNLLVRLLGDPDMEIFPMLASIDRYGDTIFNHLQIERLLVEWESLTARAGTSEEEALLEAIKSLGRESLQGVHRYLVFIGD